MLFQDYETHLEWLAEALAQRPAAESLFDAVLASVASFPHDLEVVRQAALARAELISGERAAGHLRVVQSSFADVLTDFVRSRYPDVPDIDLKADVAGAALAAALVVGVEKLGPLGVYRRPRPNRRGQCRTCAIRARAAALKAFDYRRSVMAANASDECTDVVVN